MKKSTYTPRSLTLALLLRPLWLPWMVLALWSAMPKPTALAAEAGLTLQFLVGAEPLAAASRCPVATAQHCRDDLDLVDTFLALERMATRGPQAVFPALAAGSPIAAVRVSLGAGTFRLGQELRLRQWPGAVPGVAPKAQVPLHIRGAGVSDTVVLGTVPVPAAAWQTVAPGEARVADKARAHVRVVQLAGLLAQPLKAQRRISGFAQAILPANLEVLAAGQWQTLARWPNAGWARTETAKATAGVAASPRAMRISAGRAERWQMEPALAVAGYFAYDWAFERIPVDSVNADSGELLLQAPGAGFGVHVGHRVFVENALFELDSPGEWYADVPTQRLFFWPTHAGALADVELSVATSLLAIERSSQVTVQDISFAGSTGDAIRVSDSVHVTLVDAVVRYAGNRALLVEGGSAVTVRRVAMHDLGEGGLSVSGGDRRSLTPSLHVIEGCRIERYARRSRSYRPAIAVEGVGVQLLRNRIDDGPHAAIVFGGNEHRISGNHISNVVNETNDAGAIYTGRDWTTRGTIISNNLFQNIFPRLPGTASVMGIYLDDQASGATITGNVFANVSRAVLIGGGRDNSVEHNLFVASSPAIFADNRGLTWQREQTLDPRGTLQTNFRHVAVNMEPYRSRYPRLANMLLDEPGRTKHNRARGNLFVASRDFEFLDGAQAGMALDNNLVVTWSIFKHLRAAKASYSPQDFDIEPSALPTSLRAYWPPREGIAP